MDSGNTKKRVSELDLIFGRRIRDMRIEKGFTQHELAEALGVTFQQLQKYERGNNRISAVALYKIATFLETPITYFFSKNLCIPKGPNNAISKNLLPFLEDLIVL